jgi:hypothetical protein
LVPLPPLPLYQIRAGGWRNPISPGSVLLLLFFFAREIAHPGTARVCRTTRDGAPPPQPIGVAAATADRTPKPQP